MDHLSTEARSENMRRILSRNTEPEKAVRRLLHGLGFRFRLHQQDLPGCPDIVLPKWGTVIFVHGCFWHMHPGCKRARVPRSAGPYWIEKLERNIRRDKHVCSELKRLGWKVLIVWECELRDHENLRRKLSSLLS